MHLPLLIREALDEMARGLPLAQACSEVWEGSPRSWRADAEFWRQNGQHPFFRELQGSPFERFCRLVQEADDIGA